MKELREIVNAYDEAFRMGKRTALASVVQLNGSAYRRPGARMLVTDDGEMTGAISGGCLEGDALHKAMQVIIQDNSRLVTYDTRDEDMTIGVQLGCEGVIRVLFEPINPSLPYNTIELIRKAVLVRQHSILVTIFDPNIRNRPQPGTCLLFEGDGTITGDIPIPAIRKDVILEARRRIQKRQSGATEFQSSTGAVTTFFECIQPAISLVVAGAGNDAIPMMEIASTLGWDLRVVDGRISHARPERFATACQVLVSNPEAVLEQVPIDERTAFVMMTHNYHYDLALLKALLQTPVPYIGMLGPKKKLMRMLEELSSSGLAPNDEMMGRIHGPTGLEIGAETPEEIALSIIAEIQATFSKKLGGKLRDKSDVIHSMTINSAHK